MLCAGCATLPPGMDAPKSESTALANPETTSLGRQVAALAKAHPGLSGFDLLTDGAMSFALHQEIAAHAQRTLDVQYFLMQQDDTGKLLLESLLEAADRGVHVRLLIDDAQAFDAGSAIRPLAAHPNIEIRIFNPFVVRRELTVLRWVEFAVSNQRLNYRMHNKLFIGDNAIAVTGGRNVGDEYFQASTVVNFGDFDLVVAGPTVQTLSGSFDAYWNDKLAIPVETLPLGKPSAGDLERLPQDPCPRTRNRWRARITCARFRRATCWLTLLSGRKPLVWAKATLAYDPPDKAKIERDGEPGRLMWQRVASAVEGAQRDVIIVSPYLVPGRGRDGTDPAACANAACACACSRIRWRRPTCRSPMPAICATGSPLLEEGCELYEVRPVPGQPEAHGLVKSGASGQFGLHAKVFVIDGQRVFVGSMNFDQRSFDVNTELGLIIDSRQIAGEITARFEAIAQPANSYKVALDPAVPHGAPRIVWITEKDGRTVRFDTEPEVEGGKLALVDMLSLLPIERLL